MTVERPNQDVLVILLDAWDIYCTCGQIYSLHDKHRFAIDYFTNNIRLRCEDCNQEIDWWEATLRAINDDRDINRVCSSIGSRNTMIQPTLRSNEITDVVFSEYHIPPDALILNVTYNTQYNSPIVGGTLQPMEVYENSLTRRINLQKARFYGRPRGEPPYAEARLNVTVTWAPNRPDDISWRSLINAFVYFINDTYHGALISANTAVETRLDRILKQFWEGLVSEAERSNSYNDRVKQFLQDRATYSSQLNFILPALLSFTKAPSLPSHILNALNGLRNLRNKLGHGIRTPESINKTEAAQALCAAVFGLYYLDVVSPYLLDRKSKKKKKRKSPTRT
jgi:hypothetical protein